MSLFKKIITLSTLAMSTAFIYKIYRHRTSTKEVSKKTAYNSRHNGPTTIQDESEKRTQKMYKDLEMTDVQQKEFKNSIKKIKNDWEKNHSDNPMHNDRSLSEEDKALQSVLNEVQYGMYRE